MLKVLIADKMSEEVVEIFKARNIKVDVKTGLSESDLIKKIPNYSALVIRSATKATKKVIKAGNNLKVIGRAGIGVDNIDINVATEKGIVVMNTPFGNTVTTAEHAISLLLSMARQIPDANQSMHDGKWNKSSFNGSEITGKTLGVIGSGNIGSIVVNRALGLKMKVIIYDPFLSKDRAEEMGAELVDFKNILAKSDFISIHTPLTETTKDLINKDAFKKMKKGVRIINCARGGIINEDDLIEYLENGKIGGAALDVFVKEPLDNNSKLIGTKNLILTPHLGASTVEAQERVSVQIAEQISDFLLNGTISNSLNTVSLSERMSVEVKPYKNLCYQLGSFIGQIIVSGFQEVKIEISGNAKKLPRKVLVSWILYGLLHPKVENVNPINSLLVAQERGVNVKEIINEKLNEEYSTMISIEVTTDKNNYSISGTLLGNKPRVIAIDNISIESELGDHNIYIVNKDKLGLISDLSSLLVKNKINIGTFHLGRDKKGSNAIALLNVDSSINVELINQLNKIPLVSRAEYIRF